MCIPLNGAEPENFANRTRSVRLHGVVTSIRLEGLYWDVLAEIARADGISLAQLIERLYDEVLFARGSVGNFTSFLRVSALRHQSMLAHAGPRAATPRPQGPGAALRRAAAREEAIPVGPAS